MRARLCPLLFGILLAAAPAAAPAAALAATLEMATPCRAQKIRLAGAGGSTLLLWQDGGGEKGDAKKGCKGETRAAWLEGETARPLQPDFLGAGFRAAGSGRARRRQAAAGVG